MSSCRECRNFYGECQLSAGQRDECIATDQEVGFVELPKCGVYPTICDWQTGHLKKYCCRVTPPCEHQKGGRDDRPQRNQRHY